MRTSEFDYDLPPELIAQTPLEPRDASRLLVLHRDSGRLEHRRFAHLLEYLRAGDLMVFNQSRVLPARLYGHREDTGGKVELLLLHRESPGIWRALARPGRRLRLGAKIIIEPADHGASSLDEEPASSPVEKALNSLPHSKGEIKRGLTTEILATHPDGIKTVRIEPEEEIARLGKMPLPPYIHQSLADQERYQTVYSKDLGSAAAPTAGLHFTQELLDRLQDSGVELAFVTLHVGLDTFRPVQGDDPTAHQIHTEYFHLSAESAAAINKAKLERRRVIAVGTTSVRVLEHVAQLAAKGGETQLSPATGQADLFILPGHRFQVVDALITNFHLPRSTLLMLVSAFAETAPSTSPAPSRLSTEGRSPGRSMVLNAYNAAIQERYRFYSFGDGMLIL